MESILNSIKKLVGISEEYTEFDLDIITCINSALAALTQLGVGPEEGFSISDANATWNDFLGTTKRMEMVKSYVHLKTRLMFDPPLSSAVTEVIKTQISEFEWRISVEVENRKDES